MDIAGIEAASLPFIVKNETGMHVSVKPDDSFEVMNNFLWSADIFMYLFSYKWYGVKLQSTVLFGLCS